ncbi:endo-1,4-beta-xylanase [Paenibacillus sp. 1P07SE]|uniref:endo-1,4-beta-xylanase n=1 Tax=Paenibacillus sp. 1P07SE TaxID=3132209 RepID=UPI0039A62E90
MRNKFSTWLTMVLAVALLLPPGTLAAGVGHTSAAEAGDILIDHDFESGSSPWFGRGSETVSLSSAAARSGQQSLFTEGRSDNWHGPGLNLAATGQLQKRGTYELSLHAKLREGSPDETLQLAIKQTGAANQYVNLSTETPATADDWVEIKGSYTYDPQATELELYLQSPSSKTVDYYIDDFQVKLVTAPPPGSEEPPPGPGTPGVQFVYNFEDGTTMSWGPRGGEKVGYTEEAARSGTGSIKAWDRMQDWNGPSLNVKPLLEPEITYQISAFVKLAEAPASDSTIRLSMQNEKPGEEPNYTQLASTSTRSTDWIELRGSFSYEGAMDVLSLYIESSNVSDVLYVDDVTIRARGSLQTDLPRLAEVYEEYFEIGAAVENIHLTGIHHQLLDYHYNSVVAENVMKPGSINPREGVYNWTAGDTLRDYAKANDMNLRFHTLVWHSQGNDWILQDSAGNELAPTPENKQLVLDRLETYLRAVVGRYKDDIRDWDVVNEVIDEGRPDGMRNSGWYRLTGLDFIRTAFRVTREVAGDDAMLYINDYSTHNPRKRDFLYDLVTQLRAEGVPIDGVGHQTHINITGPSIEQISDSIRLFGEAGFDNQITELDVSVYTNNTDAYQDVPEELIVKQGYRYKELFDELKRLDDLGKEDGVPGGWISNVTLWGIADDHTWLHNRPVTRQDAPFPFDKNYQAKPAYWGMVDPSRLPLSPLTARVVQGTPGEDELAWGMTPALQTERVGSLSAAFKLLWDHDNLYVQLEVRDPSHLAGDRVELFLADGDETDRFEIDRDDEDINEIPGGYRIVTALPLSEPGAIGQQLRFDIRITDSGTDDGSEHGKNGNVVSWSDPRSTQHIDQVGLGTLTLAEAVKTAQAAKGTPTIDGNRDDSWNHAAPALQTNVWVEGNAGATAEFQTLWDHEHLYVYAEVSDTLLSDASANPWEQDSIEIFVDQNNAKTSVYDSDDGQYRINYKNVRTVGGHASHDNYTSAVRILHDEDGAVVGYAVEAAIALDRIAAKPGDLIGFDLQVNNDQNGDGTRNSVAIWSDPTGQSYMNASRLGVIQLLAGAPDQLRAAANGQSAITLTWKEEPGADSYIIERAASAGGPWTQAAELPGTAISWQDTGLRAGTTYYYRVTTLHPLNESAPSPAVSATTQSAPSAPGGSWPVLPPEGETQQPGSPVEPGLIRPAVQTEQGRSIAAVSAADIAGALGQTSAGDDGITRLTIDLSAGGDAGSYELELPLVSLQGDGAYVLIITTPLGNVELPSHMLTRIGELDAGTVTIRLAAGSAEGLAAEAAGAIGSRPVLELDVLAGGQVLAWSDPDAPVTVTIPYTASSAERQQPQRLVVWHLDDLGIIAPIVSSRYDAAGDVIRFRTTHFSTFAVAAPSHRFGDLQRVPWAQTAIEAMAVRGVIRGISDEQYQPQTQVTRADFIALLVRALELQGTGSAGEMFSDVSASAYYYEELAIARELGIAQGTGDGRFQPGSAITRQDAMVLIHRALTTAGRTLPSGGSVAGFADQGDVAPYARDSAARLVSAGIVRGMGDGQLAPRQPLTRAQAAVVIYESWR